MGSDQSSLKLMKIQVANIQPRDERGKILVRITFHDDEKAGTHDNALIDVFIEHTDSYAEIRRRGIEAARDFFRRSLRAEPVEVSN